jgi:hypothetical protein
MRSSFERSQLEKEGLADAAAIVSSNVDGEQGEWVF